MSVEIDVGGSKISAGKLVFVVAMFGIAGWVLFKPAPPDLTRCQKIPDFDVVDMNPDIGPITDAVYVDTTEVLDRFPNVPLYIYGFLTEKTDHPMIYVRDNPIFYKLGGGGYTPIDSASVYQNVRMVSEVPAFKHIDHYSDGVEEVRLCLASGKFKVK